MKQGKKTLKAIFFLNVVLLCINSNSQVKYWPYDLDKNDAKPINNSLYNKIEVIDNRVDTSYLGLVTYEPFDQKIRLFRESQPAHFDFLEFKKSLQSQLQEIFEECCMQNAGNKTLVLNIRKMYFFNNSELQTYRSGIPFSRKDTIMAEFIFYADLFVKDNNTYKFLDKIDTTFLFNKEITFKHRTKVLTKESSKIILEFIQKNLNKPPSLENETITEKDMKGFELFYANKFSLYKNDNLIDGAYLNYNSFKNQIPDFEIHINNDEKLTDDNVFIKDENKKLKKINKRKIYALVYKNKPYIIAESWLPFKSFKFIELEKHDGIFFFKNFTIVFKGVNSFSAKALTYTDRSFFERRDLILGQKPQIINFSIDVYDGTIVPEYYVNEKN